MKSLTNYINEKLIVNKNYKPYTYAPKSFDELRKIIEDRYDKLGPGTEQNPIDFNDIDVSNIDSFYNCNENKGIFSRTDFKYIDISYWDVSNIKYMSYMFHDSGMNYTHTKDVTVSCSAANSLQNSLKDIL